MSRPDGIESLEGVVVAKPNATVTMPAEWVRDLLAYVREMEVAQTDPLAAWQPIETAPTDGTPLLLFARSKNARAPIRIVGWFLADIGWIEGCFVPNQPIGIVPTHWMPLPRPPELRP